MAQVTTLHVYGGPGPVFAFTAKTEDVVIVPGVLARHTAYVEAEPRFAYVEPEPRFAYIEPEPRRAKGLI